MTDITEQDLRDAREWAEDFAEMFKYDNEVSRETRAAVNYILATVDAPEPTLAEEVKKGLLFRVNDTDAEGIKDALDLAARVEKIEQERDEARAEVERLTAVRVTDPSPTLNDGSMMRPATVAREENVAPDQHGDPLPDPADVPYGEAWLVEYHGDCVPALRRLDHPGEWYLVRKNGTGGHVRNEDIRLVSRLVPAPRQITTREELDALPRRTVIRDADGITCERARSSETWYCPLEDCDQTPFIALPATVLYTPEETA